MNNILKHIETTEELRKLLEEYGASTYIAPDIMEDQRINVGGMEGGSCWGGDARPYTTGETFRETDGALFQLFKTHWRDIGFLDYQEIVEEVLSEESYTEHEYYGNETRYRIRIIDVAKLLIIIKEKRA